jgi:hypothetical protein
MVIADTRAALGNNVGNLAYDLFGGDNSATSVITQPPPLLPLLPSALAPLPML